MHMQEGSRQLNTLPEDISNIKTHPQHQDGPQIQFNYTRLSKCSTKIPRVECGVWRATNEGSKHFPVSCSYVESLSHHGNSFLFGLILGTISHHFISHHAHLNQASCRDLRTFVSLLQPYTLGSYPPRPTLFCSDRHWPQQAGTRTSSQLKFLASSSGSRRSSSCFLVNETWNKPFSRSFVTRKPRLSPTT